MTTDGSETPTNPAVIPGVSRRGPGGRQPGAGRKPTHGARILRRTLRALTTKRLDGRSALAVAVRRFKEDIRTDLGGDLTRAQETIVELAAQRWIVVQSLHHWIGSQTSLITRKRKVLDVVLQAAQLEEGLAKMLDRLGLERRARDASPGRRLADAIMPVSRPAVAEVAAPPAEEPAGSAPPSGEIAEPHPSPASAGDAAQARSAGGREP